MPVASVLDFSGRGLKVAPPIAPDEDVSKLDLSSNRLAELPAHIFELLNLEQVDLATA